MNMHKFELISQGPSFQIFFCDSFKRGFYQHLTLWRARQLSFFYVQILPELKNTFALKDIVPICWGIIKVKILYKISGMKFSSLELKLCCCAVQPPPLKGLKSHFSSWLLSNYNCQNISIEKIFLMKFD